MLVFTLPAHSAIGPLWSVSIEEQFYLAWPLLLAWSPRRSLRPVCLGMIVAAFVLRVVILVSGGGLAQIWMNTIAHLDPIAIGALIALRHHDRPIALGPRARAMAGVGAPLVVVAMTALLTRALLKPGFLEAGYRVRGGLAIAVATSSILLVGAWWFYDPRALDTDAPGGVLHAKAVVADDEAVFVTSANLTEAALERNIELGLLVRDRALAASISTHFRGLIDRGLLRALPAE